MKTKYSITSEGMLPYLAFPDLQSYFDSLSLKQFNDWDKKLNRKKEVHSEHIVAAIAVYLRELQQQEIWLTEQEIAKLCDKFSISCSLANNVRIGHMLQTGRLSMITVSSTFKLSDAGIKHVESMIGKP